MTVRVALRHRTRYAYDRLIALGPQVVRLRPAPHSRTRVTSYSIRVAPTEHFENWQQDPQGNWLLRLVFPEKSRELALDVDLVAELEAVNPFEFFLEPEADFLPFEYAPETLHELQPFLERSAGGPLLDELVKSLRPKGRRTVDFLVELNRLIHERTRYLIRLEAGVQSPDETLERRSGSCRDSAWLQVQVLRRLGLAARFASGYLVQLKADEKPLDGPAGPAEDFTDLHAWAEVYLPGAGWIGLDATSGLLAAEGHIPLACTPDPASAAPLSGALDECESVLEHSMRVTRIHETPRVTLPYTDAQWTAITALGERVDSDLREGDVRLTMGGEPTFVSIDDMDGYEWTFGALGEDKRRRAGVLFRRLAERFAKGALLHYGQGKWYPGEPLPRWALGCYFRADGEPVWTDSERIAKDDTDYGMTSDDARAFLHALALRLGVSPDDAQPGYEDAFHYMLRERTLPVNVDVLDNRIEDELERARVSRIFEQGLRSVVGYALPLRSRGRGRWQSGPWFLRREHLFLVPGDSPMGYRLPLDSLPWVAEGDYPYVLPRDPFASREALPTRGALRERRVRQSPLSDDFDVARSRPRPFESASDVVRSAVCAEARRGILHIFLPPIEELDDYLDLVLAVEETARERGISVRIEGYPPPHDPRLVKLSVTPDPGVIEVNVHPSRSFGELTDTVNALYDEARKSRLGTEKFTLDGRHSGTGGGNHVTLGGPTPGDSPFLRRPDLLASLIGFFHDHPALSYLFSGLFIGPTSQAPRVDEARLEATHELEVAIGVARSLGPNPAPWLTDRVFRHVLADVTGNTHRAEFCIDKLYSPDSATGRLGIVELRAFEMPPHPRMSLAVQLLVRAMVSAFWQRPYRPRLPRWDTSLHDRFLLPHFVALDFREVLAELGERGYAFEPAWFDAHFEFRFPFAGSIAHQGVELSLRHALEPWHVLPEEADPSGGVSRAVDSSLARVEVRLRGAAPGRHLVTCNGALVPLHPTGTQGESVAGVRFRAWRLPSSLHPTLPLDAPLVFSLVDRWTERALGGCTLHVSHAGGRAYSTFPVNAVEAESRRVALFSGLGHAHGAIDEKRLLRAENPDFPLTLDLRRVHYGP